MRHVYCLVGVMLMAAAGVPGQDLSPVTGSAPALNNQKLGTAKFMIDSDAKSLVVIADETTNATITRLIEQLDQPVPQALIKVLFLEVTHTDDLDVGTELAYSQIRGNTKTSYETAFDLAGLTNGGAATILRNDLEVTLKALAKAHHLEVLSRPSIMTRSNEEAVITIGEEVPFVRNSQITTDGRVLNTIEYEDVGIILRVTPRIDVSGIVELTVEPEISTVTGETVPISEGVSAPTFSKRSAQTKIIVPCGRTVVIGGLMDTYESKSEQKVPLLGDIPLLGHLFKRTVKEKTKKELLIFLTPNVVKTVEEAVALGKAEKDNSTFLSKQVDAETLKQYLGDTPKTPEP